MEKENKMISFLSVVLLICTILFASIYNETVERSQHISRDNWSVSIDSISNGKKTGSASSIDVDASSTTAIVYFTMLEPNDSITYNIRVSNNGTLDATLDSILVVGNSDNITYDISGTLIGSRLNAGGVDNVVIKFTNISEEEKDIQENIAIILNYK